MIDVNKGPLYEILSEGFDRECPALCQFVDGRGRKHVGVAEFVRLANADAVHGERPRSSGDYGP